MQMSMGNKVNLKKQQLLKKQKVLETQLKIQRGIVCMSFKKGFKMIALTVVAAAGLYTIATDRNTTSIQIQKSIETQL